MVTLEQRIIITPTARLGTPIFEIFIPGNLLLVAQLPLRSCVLVWLVQAGRITSVMRLVGGAPLA